MPAKIEDVARAAGVSIMSVSRALRGVEGVSEKTRSKIVAEAARLGYRPSRLAGGLSQENSTLIGVSVPTLFDAVFAEILDGMKDGLALAGLETIIETTEYDAAKEEAFVDRMCRWSPAGVILTGAQHSAAARSRLKMEGRPVLEIWDISEEPIDVCVGVDHFAAGYDMGREMAARGYRRPGFVSAAGVRDTCAARRRDGFAKALAEAGGAGLKRFVEGGRSQFESGFAGAGAAFAADVDILYFLNDHLAFGGLMAADAHGVSCPDEIGIVGFNDLRLNKVLPRPLTTTITPRKVMGATAARRLVARINGAATPPVTCLPVEISLGATTRGP